MPGTDCAAINVPICRSLVPGRAGGYTPGRSAAYENQALLEWGRTFSDFWVKQFFICTASKRTKMFALWVKITVLA